jgi:eukaryotic-like serine/threonine-protein kinase
MTDTSDEGGTGPLLKNRYRLGRVLGRGGMCIVYQAWDTRLQRNVAVKRLEPPLSEDPRTRARFDREGRALAQLSHPNLVTLIDRGSSDNEDYLVFEYVEGRSLKEMIREGLMSVGDIGRVAGQVAEGLAAAHSLGIIHRDVKPQNILIDRNGHAKVSDFGIATGPDWTRVTRAGSVIGSARYMSPEQIRSKPVDARSDIYSLGVVMYEMLTGTPPFDGLNMPEIARMHLNATPPPISDLRVNLPEGLEKVVMRCLEKLPDDRFASMDELLGALVGLGLYAPQRTAEVTPPHKRARRSTYEDRASRYSSTGASTGSDSGSDDEIKGPALARAHGRELARKRRARLRWRILGALVAIAVVVLVIVLVLALSGGGAPDVVGLSVDQAKALATEAGMEVEITDQVVSFDRDPLIVLEQSPLPKVKADDDVLRLTVTKQPDPVKVTDLQDADPEGDAVENPDQLSNLIDGDESTVWTTELYRSSAFGDLKTGVGIDFTLEAEATIIKVVSKVEGWKGQLLYTTSSGGTAKLADFNGQLTQIITLGQPVSEGRIWFTELAQLTDTRWGVELSEIEFYK